MVIELASRRQKKEREKEGEHTERVLRAVFQDHQYFSIVVDDETSLLKHCRAVIELENVIDYETVRCSLCPFSMHSNHPFQAFSVLFLVNYVAHCSNVLSIPCPCKSLLPSKEKCYICEKIDFQFRFVQNNSSLA